MKALRPQTLEDYIGQAAVIARLRVAVAAAIRRSEPLGHMLLSGPPGLGKTTLARLIAEAAGTKRFIATSGPALSNPEELDNRIKGMMQNETLFIDEIHRLPKTLHERLYPVLEDQELATPSGAQALPAFTVIAGTTRPDLLAAPLAARLTIQEQLSYYNTDELSWIIINAAERDGNKIEVAGAYMIAERSRGTPRVALALWGRVRDYVIAETGMLARPKAVEKALDALGVDKAGLTDNDREYLNALITKFHGGPTGLSTLAAASGIEQGTLAEFVEPFLLLSGFLDRTPTGRRATKHAYNYFAHRG